jgi:hypothetical protein
VALGLAGHGPRTLYRHSYRTQRGSDVGRVVTFSNL